MSGEQVAFLVAEALRRRDNTANGAGALVVDIANAVLVDEVRALLTRTGRADR